MPFDGFESDTTECPSGARVFSYRRSSGRVASTDAPSTLPLLVLLHGYPQNSLMWREFVKDIPAEWAIFVPDLPGYGNSTKPIDPSAPGRAHSKQEWAKDIVHAIDTLCGPERRFIAYGHDRGGRLAYRLALDFPDRVVGAAVLDIMPTSYVWDAMRLEKGHAETHGMHHWVFLASPAPIPETLIGGHARFYLDLMIRKWTGSRQRDADTQWITDSVAPYLDPERGRDRIAASCEDYRAGATLDIEADYASKINPLEYRPSSTGPPHPSPPFRCPLLVLASGGMHRRFDVHAIWSSLSASGNVQSYQIGDESVGHFIVNEAQAETVQRTLEWLGTF